jgi:signal transduction histidine kinase
MIPAYEFGLYGVGQELHSIVQNVFGQSQSIEQLDDQDAAETFIADISFPNWKILVSSSSYLSRSELLLTNLRDIYIKIKTFHLVIFITEDPFGSLTDLAQYENVHIISAASNDQFVEAAHHFHGIKASLDSFWLYAKISDVLSLYESAYLRGLDYKNRIQYFLEHLLRINQASSVTVFFLQNGAQDFYIETGYGPPSLSSVPRAVVEDLFEFDDTCITYIVQTGTDKLLFSNSSSEPSEITIISTFKLDAIPGFVVYRFKEPVNEILLKALCNVSSRELRHLYRSKHIRSQYETLKALTEIEELDDEKRNVLFKILFNLKRHFGADGVAIVELIPGPGKQLNFEKTFIERARKGVDAFPGDRGFAHHCVLNKKALLINDAFVEGNTPIGIGYEFDPDRLGIDQGKKVKINSLRAPHASEDEKSIMYFPIRRGNVLGAIKISDFTNQNGFHLQQLRSLGIFADAVGAMLSNIRSISQLKIELERKAAQEEMLNVAEVLFFYREITLGIFHQVGNHLDTIDSEMLMLEILAGSRVEKTPDIYEHIKEAKGQIRLAKDLISKAHQRGLSLNPIEQMCELLRDVIRPAIDYARKRTKNTNIEIRHSLSSDQYVMKLDIELAKESIINLLNNAIWAVKSNWSTKKEIFIAVRKTPDGKQARIEIEDSGIGIDPENFKKLFTPGFTTRQGGTGLGLYFTRNLIEHFGGTVNFVKSNPGKGTTVIIMLPLLEGGV